MTAPAAFAPRLQAALGAAYAVEGVLGEGGFAVVYRARDLRLKRAVAVKAIRPGLAETPGVAERFRREAEAVAQLRHPNIVPVYDVGGEGDTTHYIMPLIEGESLRQRLTREGRLPIADIRAILAAAASALEAAHQRGIVHRDVKPENIMLEGSERRVLLMDFGIAKALAAGPGALTGTGVIIGTPQYMSPEQASGERDVDFRSDLYSLGVVAYEMLTGRVPFAGEAILPLLAKLATEPAPPIRPARPDCPDDLRAAVERCLAKEPSARWPSAAALVQALEGAGGPAAAAVGGAAAPPARRFWMVAAAAVGAVAGIAALELLVAGTLLATPVALFAALLALAVEYGRMAAGGLGWRDLVRSGHGRAAAPTGGGEYGDYLRVVEQARRDRAAILGLLEHLPGVERRALPDLKASVDELVWRVEEAGRRLAATRVSLSTEHDPALRDEGARHRTSLEQRLETAGSALGEIRAAVRRAGGVESASIARRLEQVLGPSRRAGGG